MAITIEQRIEAIEKDIRQMRNHSGHHQHEMVDLKMSVRKAIALLKNGKTADALAELLHECRVGWMTPREKVWFDEAVKSCDSWHDIFKNCNQQEQSTSVILDSKI